MKRKKKYSLAFISAYLLLLIYSSFHIHQVDHSSRNLISESESPISTYNDDKFYYGLYVCHFNLTYNSFSDAASSQAGCVVFGRQFPTTLIPEDIIAILQPVSLSFQHRGPPVFS